MASQTSRVRRIEHFRNMETMTAYTQRKSERKREKGIDRLNRRSIRLLMISYTKRNVCARALRPHTGRHSFWLFFCYCCSLYSIEIESLFHFFALLLLLSVVFVTLHSFRLHRCLFCVETKIKKMPLLRVINA